jgi:hypothetical protein
MTASAAFDALDLLLALRPEDLDPDELAAAEAMLLDERAQIEADDAALAAWIEDWAEEPGPRLSFTGADILARAANEPGSDLLAADDGSLSPAGVERPTSSEPGRAAPASGGAFPLWLVPVALAASLAAVLYAGWRVMDTPVDVPEMRAKALVGDHEASRLALQFSVERGTEVRPGRNGAVYGPDDALAFRFDLAGEAGHVALLEVSGDGAWQVVYPLDGGTVALDPGLHVLAGDDGAPLVYRPDGVAAGTLEYVAVVLSDPVDPGRVVPGLLAAGLHRADLWPRPVVAVDAVTVTWEAR